MVTADNDILLSELAAVVDRAEGLLGAVLDAMPLNRGDSVDIDWLRKLNGLTAQLRHRAELAEMLAAGAVNVAQLHKVDQVSTSRRWVAEHHGLTHAEASKLVRADSAWRRHRGLTDAIRSATITVAHLDAISGMIPQHLSPEDEQLATEVIDSVLDDFLRGARDERVDDFRSMCGRAHQLIDPDGSAPEGSSKPHAPSNVRLSPLFNGRWSLTGDLSADDGAFIASLLDAAMANAHRAAKNAGDDALAQHQAKSAAQRRADALLDLLIKGSGATEPGRAGIYLHIDLDALLNADVASPDDLVTGAGMRAHTEANLDVTDETLWAWFAGADVTPVFNHGGQPVGHGRTRRVASDIQRRILAHRYRGCVNPACDATPNWCQAHHITPWEHGGATDIDNLVPKCGYDHKADHDKHREIQDQPPKPKAWLHRLRLRREANPRDRGAGNSDISGNDERLAS